MANEAEENRRCECTLFSVKVEICKYIVMLKFMSCFYFSKPLFMYNLTAEEMGFVESVKPNASGLEGEVLNVKS